jgi:hypothetical protein
MAEAYIADLSDPGLQLRLNKTSSGGAMGVGGAIQAAAANLSQLHSIPIVREAHQNINDYQPRIA